MSLGCDIAIIGAGIAGAGLAAALAARGVAGRTVLLEGEAQPGYHATGRSAAFWTESYGGPGIQPLTSASGPALRAAGVLRPRGALTIARATGAARLTDFAERYAALGVRVELLDRSEVAARVPGLRPPWVAGALEPDCCDIDVAALHQHYLQAARVGGTKQWTGARLVGAMRHGARWELGFADGRTLTADTLVIAAGAWADHVARLAGARPLGIRPFRRTVAQVRTTPVPSATLPLVLDLDERFYFKPQGAGLWLSPHDESPSPPCDAAPDELDVATAIDLLQQVVDWRVERVERRWAGLRSFAPDRLPVYGWDARAAGLFWCAGQGGFGIQTAPAGSDMAARLLLGEGAGAVDPQAYRAARFD